MDSDDLQINKCNSGKRSFGHSGYFSENCSSAAVKNTQIFVEQDVGKKHSYTFA